MRAKFLPRTGLACAAIVCAAILGVVPSAVGRAPAPEHNVFPPWQRGANNDAPDRGVDFTVPQIDDLADFHGDLADPKLVLYALADLARPELRLAMPNPGFEGVARQIKASLGKAGGEALTKAVYGTKVTDGSAMLTRVHHRQTPLFLMQGMVDAGVTWQSEAIFQEQIGNPISHVDIPDAENTTAIYALAIFEKYGFKPYDSPKQGAD